MSHLSKKRSKAYAFLLLNTALWGFAAPIIKYSLRFVSPNSFLLSRYLLASLIFLPIFLITPHPPLKLRGGNKGGDTSKLIFLALLGTPLTLLPLYYGLTLTTSIEASFLVASGPITTVLGGWLFLKEKVTTRERFGILIAFLGTILIALKPALNAGNSPSSLPILGNLLILLSNLVWTVFLLSSKRLKTDPAQLSLTSYFVSIPVFALLVMLEPSSLNSKFLILDSPALPGIFYMAVFGSVIAFYAYSAAQKLIEASEAAVFTYLQPLFALPLAVFWLKEPLSLPLITGMILISLGVVTSESR